MTERELSRGAARRLAIIQHVEEVTGNVAMTCRYFGISRHTYYFWLRRYQQLGPEFQAGFHWHLLDKGIQHALEVMRCTPQEAHEVPRIVWP